MSTKASVLAVALVSACASGQRLPPPASAAPSTQPEVFVFRNPKDHRATYGDRARDSAVFDEASCAKTLGEVTRSDLQSVYARIPWTEPVEPETFSRVEADLGKILSEAGHQPSTATFTTDELAADLSAVKYFEGAPVCDFERGYLSRTLQSLREPDMQDAPDGSYRFLWVRAFDMPLVVRVVGPPTAATLIVKVLSGAVDSQPTKLCLRVERALTAQQYDSLHDGCSNPHVWQWSEEDLPHVKDGARWVVESRQGGQHRFGRARSPDDGELRDCALRILDIAGIPKGEVY